jgi:hypothetical protein
MSASGNNSRGRCLLMADLEWTSFGWNRYFLGRPFGRIFEIALLFSPPRKAWGRGSAKRWRGPCALDSPSAPTGHLPYAAHVGGNFKNPLTGNQKVA